MRPAAASRRAPISLVVRLTLVGGLFGGAAATYLLWPSRNPSGSRTAGAEPRLAISAGTAKMGVPWYRENLPLWQSLDYVSLSDLGALEAAIRSIVANRYPGSEIDEGILCRDLTAHFHAFGADTSEEYLRRLQGYRRLRTCRELYDDAGFQGGYQYLTGDELPRDVDPQEALRLFWQGRPGAGAHPVRLATRAFLQVGYTKPIPAQRGPHSVLGAMVVPSWSMYADSRLQPELERWIGPFCVGFARLTVPLVEFDEAIAREQRLLICGLFFVVQDARGNTFPANMDFYLLPNEQQWNMVLGGVYNPYELYWPL